jgi:hypothetical protein
MARAASRSRAIASPMLACLSWSRSAQMQGSERQKPPLHPSREGSRLQSAPARRAAIYLDQRGSGKKVCPNVHLLAAALRSTASGRTRRRNNVVCAPGCSRLPYCCHPAEGPMVKNSVGSGLLAGEAGGIEAGRTRRSGACAGSGLPLGSQPGRGERPQERTRPRRAAGRSPASMKNRVGNFRALGRRKLSGFP